MTGWVAIAYGALDITGMDALVRSGVEYMILPALPCDEPIGLQGEVAELWLSLLGGPVPESQFTESQLALVQEFAAFGIASPDPSHPARITRVSEPWLMSPLHEMIYALVHSVAREHGIEIVFIKGPVLHRQGLRDKEHSGDIDVLVDPRRILELQEALAVWGWNVHLTMWDGTELSHSITLEPAQWGCEIDLHRRFPGVGLGDQEAFGRVHGTAGEVVFASVTARVAAPLVNGLFAALHLARPLPPGHRPRDDEHDDPVAILQRCGTPVIGLAQRFGADAALEAHLREAFPQERIVVTSPLPFNWVWLRQPTRARYYLFALGHASWHEKPGLAARILWPTRRVAFDSSRSAGLRESSSVRARLSRFKRIFAAFRVSP